MELTKATNGHEYAMITLGNKLFKLITDSFRAGVTFSDQIATTQKRFERVKAYIETDIIPSTAHFRLNSISKEAGKNDLIIVQVDPGGKDQPWWIDKFARCRLIVNNDLTNTLRSQATGWEFVFVCEVK